MNKVLCFGELLLRFSPSPNGEWLSSNQMPVFVGGAELNVATALSTWGVPVKYCTAVPDHAVARDIHDRVVRLHAERDHFVELFRQRYPRIRRDRDR